MSKIQLQPGMSLNQFFTKYGDEQQCEAVLEDSRWPNGFQCPKCNSEHHYRYRRIVVERKDESGTLVHAFNHFLDNLKSLVDRIDQSAVNVAAASGQLTSTAGR